jgi:hypothetical protein
MRAVWHVLWIAALAICASGVAGAASFDVDGAQLGMTQEALQARFGDKIVCTARTPSDTDPSQTTCVNAVFSKNKTLTDTFAGQKTVIFYHILDGQLARISFLGFPSLAFDSVLQTMEAKYGKAKVVVEEIRAMVKGKLVDKHATWHNDSGDAIIFDKFSPGNINYSILNFYADSYRKRTGTG